MPPPTADRRKRNRRYVRVIKRIISEFNPLSSPDVSNQSYMRTYVQSVMHSWLPNTMNYYGCSAAAVVWWNAAVDNRRDAFVDDLPV